MTDHDRTSEADEQRRASTRKPTETVFEPNTDSIADLPSTLPTLLSIGDLGTKQAVNDALITVLHAAHRNGMDVRGGYQVEPDSGLPAWDIEINTIGWQPTES